MRCDTEIPVPPINHTRPIFTRQPDLSTLAQRSLHLRASRMIHVCEIIGGRNTDLQRRAIDRFRRSMFLLAIRRPYHLRSSLKLHRRHRATTLFDDGPPPRPRLVQ